MPAIMSIKSSGPSFLGRFTTLVFSLLSTVKEQRWSSIRFDWNRDSRSKKLSSSLCLSGVATGPTSGFCTNVTPWRCLPSGVN